MAAERAGNAILAIRPNWLIVVEGVQSHNDHWYWWGGNLVGADSYPVRLSVPNQLVNSPDDYPASVCPQPWISDPSYPTGIAPIHGWKLEWGWSGNQQITSLWNGTLAPSGQMVMVANAPYNATIPAGGTTVQPAEIGNGRALQLSCSAVSK